MSFRLILGNQHPHKFESISTEFKEFCLNHPNHSGLINIDNICKTGILTNYEKMYMQKLILKSLKNYFIKYIPKYTSAFLNSNIDNAKLIIGVNDYSEITGIPFFGLKQELTEYIDSIKDIPNNYLSIKNNILIQIDQLEIDNCNYLKDSSDMILNDFYYKMSIKNHLEKKYKYDRLKWTEKINEYTCKLPVLLETKKHEFNNYLKQHAPDLLNWQIYPHEMRNISHLKVDKSHYIYWLMKFKEKHISYLHTIKPHKPKNFSKPIYGPNFLLNNLTEMRSKFIKQNSDLNYFIITIKFPKNNVNHPIYYYNIDNNEWVIKKRYHDKNGPCCL